MFENKSENEAKNEILKMVEEYCNNTIIKIKNLKLETEYLMHQGYMTVKKWLI